MEKVELFLSHEDRELFHRLLGGFMAFADSIAKLDADVKALIALEGSVAAAVAAKDAADAAAVDVVDAQVVAALPPPPPPPAPVVPVV